MECGRRHKTEGVTRTVRCTPKSPPGLASGRAGQKRVGSLRRSEPPSIRTRDSALPK
jgi:hypothetical protein